MNNINEDIKILEELTEEYNSQHYMDMPLINGKQIQALENLIKRYRELEETQKSYNIAYYLGKSFANKQWESKIKEKIEELDKQRIKMEKDDIGVGFTLGNDWSDIKAKIQVLQELMEDK